MVTTHEDRERESHARLPHVVINGWNRLANAFRPEVGKYQPRGKAE